MLIKPRVLLRDLLRNLFPSALTGACLVFAYEYFPYRSVLLGIILIPLGVAFVLAITEMVLRTKSHAANLSDSFRILEQMEASGQITSTQQRILMNTLLDSAYSSEEKLDIEVGESIRRHSDSLNTTLAAGGR